MKIFTEAIRCKHTQNGKQCGKVLCVRCNHSEITIKRHGREVSGIPLIVGYPIRIKCEVCHKTTTIEPYAERTEV